MNAFFIIALVFCAIMTAWVSAVFFIRMGIKLEKRHEKAAYFAQPIQHAIPADGYIRRVPGQEPGFVESPEQCPTFEEVMRNQGRAVAYVKGGR